LREEEEFGLELSKRNWSTLNNQKGTRGCKTRSGHGQMGQRSKTGAVWHSSHNDEVAILGNRPKKVVVRNEEGVLKDPDSR